MHESFRAKDYRNASNLGRVQRTKDRVQSTKDKGQSTMKDDFPPFHFGKSLDIEDG